MQYKRLGNLVAVVLASAVGWSVTANLRPLQAETSEETVAAESPETAATNVAKVGEPASTQREPLDTESQSTIAKVFSHELESRPAATVYVRDIPVLTFIQDESEADTQEIAAADVPVDEVRKLATKAIAEVVDETSPLWKANQLASTFNQLSQSGDVDAESILVRWKDDNYLVEMDDTTLVTLDDAIILPDTTGARAEDALQATNRLRRLLGVEAAEPLEEVADLPAPPEPEPAPVVAQASSYYQEGWASWYGPGFHGNLTANGEIYNQNALTAAHRYLSFGTWVRVTNLNNGYAVNVRINDRGPYAGDRVIDLSAGAADYIGLTNSGVAPVRIDILN